MLSIALDVFLISSLQCFEIHVWECSPSVWSLSETQLTGHSVKRLQTEARRGEDPTPETWGKTRWRKITRQIKWPSRKRTKALLRQTLIGGRARCPSSVRSHCLHLSVRSPTCPAVSTWAEPLFSHPGQHQRGWCRLVHSGSCLLPVEQWRHEH